MGGHDLANTHNHEAANPGYNTGYISVRETGTKAEEGRCGCASGRSSPWGLLALPLLVRRRRQRR